MSTDMNGLIEQFKHMTLGELTEFCRQFEETFDVSAEQPTRGPVPGDPEDPAEEDEPADFTVRLVSFGAKKISVIKAIRSWSLGLGLKEAKDLVESAPVDLLTGVDLETAEKARAALLAEGAHVTVTPPLPRRRPDLTGVAVAGLEQGAVR